MSASYQTSVAVAVLLCISLGLWLGIDTRHDLGPTDGATAAVNTFIPPFLRSIFICMSLHFDVERLAYLKLVSKHFLPCILPVIYVRLAH